MVEQSEIEQDHGFDTDQQYIAGVYAKSLIDAAEKVGRTDEILEQLDSFNNDVLAKIPQLAASLKSPSISPENKASLIDKALKGRADDYLINFLKVLNNHGRLDCLRAINSEARAQFNELRGRVEASVTVADDLPEDLQEAVRSKLAQMLGKDVLLQIRKDPSIIGGMIVKVGDTVYDSSVTNQLQQMKENVLDGAMQKVRGSIGNFASDDE